MKTSLTRLVILTALLVGSTLASAQAASADYWGAWRWPGSTSPGFPDICLTADVNVLTGFTPDKHNVAAANSCASNLDVEATVRLYNSDGSIAAYSSLTGTNYAQVSLKDATGKGQYWYWRAKLTTNGDSVSFSDKSCGSYGCAFMSGD